MGLVVRGLNLRDVKVEQDPVALDLNGGHPELAQDVRVQALRDLNDVITFGILSF